MKKITSLIMRNITVLAFAIIGLAAGYMMGTPSEASAINNSAQVCPNSASCNGDNCATKETCRKSGCGCGCVSIKAN